MTGSVSTVDRIESIEVKQWDQLTSPDFPFFDHAYLSALESSQAVGGATGWTPHYLLLSDENKLEGASVLYTKLNSYGEYIFDWGWARAYRQHGVPYYPKLLSAAPFTPATGPKLLMAQGTNRAETASKLIRAAKKMVTEFGHSSLHYLFITESEKSYFEAEGFLIRNSFQYHWENRGYATFEDFLAVLKPKRRKQIVRERQQLQSEGLQIRILTGEQLTPEHAVVFHRFYLSTIEKMEAIPYLNVRFFQQIFATMRDEVVLMLAEDPKSQNEPIAGALYYRKGESLFGRYWGASREVRNLHFELCYYQPIAWAIKRLRLFEAGAQGEHKIARGFLPELTYSAHWIINSAFREAIGQFIAEEKRDIETMFDDLKRSDPYQHRQ